MPVINKKSYLWKVDPEPKGLCRVFYVRKFPSLEDKEGNLVASIYSKSKIGYGHYLRNRNDLDLFVRFFDYSNIFERKTLESKLEFKTLAEAKAYAEKLVKLYPEKIYDSSRLSLFKKA